MPNWTVEQQHAIEIEGCNTLVSAGAGSGKTAVLTERVYQLIKKGYKLDEIVVLTFTNNAAREMKERIRSRLLEDSSLETLADEIDTCFITTYDAFSLELVKRYHYLLSLSKNINICDDSIIKIKKQTVLDEIFDYLYISPSKEFKHLIQTFCFKDDTVIKQFILEVDKGLDNKIDRNQYLDQYVEQHFNEENIKKDLERLRKYIQDKIKELMTSLAYFDDQKDALAITSSLSGILEAKNYDELFSYCFGHAFPRAPSKFNGMPRTQDQKDLRKKFIQEIIPYLEMAQKGDSDTIVYKYMSTKDDVVMIIKIVKLLSTKMEEIKRGFNTYTFSDITRLSLSLLDHPLVQKEIISKFRCIMVDEYQDTNDIQETFLKKISSNNLYMVGDVKQAIYRFRNANCELFMDKYLTYNSFESQNKIPGVKIDMNQNFRSRSEVIEDINAIFSNIMSLDFGGANYQKEHLVIASNKAYEEEGQSEQNYNLEVYCYDTERKDKSSYGDSEIEARIIAEDILKKVHQYEIFDKKTKEFHKANYGDFAILIDRKTSFDIYKKVFEEYHIPLKIQKDENLSDSLAIKVLKNLLNVFSSILFDEFDANFTHAFMSIYRSFLYQGDDQELENLILNQTIKKSSLYKQIQEIVIQTKNKPLSYQVMELLKEFEFENKLVLVGDIEVNENNMEYLLSSIKSMEVMGYTIKDFISYLDQIFKLDIKLASKFSDDGSDAVKLLSIHASKGLEYPIVYYSGLGKAFNLSDASNKMIFSKEYGIILPYANDNNAKHLYHDLVKIKDYQDELGEKIRLWYVALTRAKEKMIVIYPNNFEPSLALSTSMHLASFVDHSGVPSSYYKHIDLGEFVSGEHNDYINNVQEELEIRAVSIPFIKKEVIRASKEAINVEQEKLDLGINLHFIFEIIDFNHPNYSFVNNPYHRSLIDNFFTSELYQIHKNDTAYHEYAYFDEDKAITGIIDLLLINDSQATIIDFKTSSVDSESYNRQLNIYASYIKQKFNREVKAYLYSIMKGEFKEVNIEEKVVE